MAREFPIANGKLVTDLDANGKKIGNAVLEGYVKETPGKGLSANDYTTAEKEKLAGIQAGAQKNPDLTPYAKKADLEGFATEADLLAFYYPGGNVTSMDQITTNGIEYAVGDDGGAYVVSGDGLSGHVVLPWKVEIEGKEYKVTGIGTSAFDDESYPDNSFTEFTAPITVKTVGDFAFYIRPSLASISLPSATGIGNVAFNGCEALSSISLPSATSIGEYAFNGCRSLTSVFLPSVTSIGDGGFNACSSLSSVSLPSATSIGKYAFYKCEALKYVDFGSAPKESVPDLDINVFVSSNPEFIIPLGMYDRWIAADGWKDLYAGGHEFVGYASMEQVKAAIPKYDFVTAAIADGKVTVAPYTNAKLVSDGTEFSVAVAEGDGKTRDCVLRVECAGLETAPTITWPANFRPRTDAETDFACVSGVRNVYWISEYAEGEFCVAGWQETAGGNAE